MRILFVLAYYHPYIGGLEHLFKQLAEGLANRGHSVKVITSQLPNTPSFENINGVEVQRIWVPHFFDRHIFTVLCFPSVVREASGYDLIHTAWYNGALPVYWAKKVIKRPAVFTALEILGQRWRVIEPHPLKFLFFQTVEKLVSRLSFDRYVSISQATHNSSICLGVDPTRARIIYPGIDEDFSKDNLSATGGLRSQCGIGEDQFLYLYFGRPGITKGIEFLLMATPDIQRQVPGAHLILILGPEPRERYLRLRRLAEQLNLNGSVHFVPPVPDRNQLAQYLLEANCIVVPSLSEGFGFSAAEACALGIPVVATRAGSLPEVVSGSYVLIEPASSQAICEGVLRAYKGQYDSWIPTKQFSWGKMVAEYEDVYRELTITSKEKLRVNENRLA